MRRSRRGVTLIEMLFALAISGMVLGVGYGMYAQTLRVQDVEAARESSMLTVQNAMARMKQDVRAGSSAHVSGSRLFVNSDDGEITYANLPGGGLARVRGATRVIYSNVTASFANDEAPARGVTITMQSVSKAHRRPIRIEISSYVSPRN